MIMHRNQQGNQKNCTIDVLELALDKLDEMLTPVEECTLKIGD